jgi:nitrogen regulatory protein P-II 1
MSPSNPLENSGISLACLLLSIQEESRGLKNAESPRRVRGKTPPHGKETHMKRIEAIIRPTTVGRVCLALERAGHPGASISQIEGRSREGTAYLLRGKTYNADLMTETRVELIVKDRETDMVVEAIRGAAFTGGIEDGRIFIHPMEEAIRIRTGETGEKAL